MNPRLPWLLCLFSSVAIAEAPGDFAFAVPIETEGTQALFALELPAAVYEGVVRADLGDLRVFNAAGEPVPHAFLPQAKASREKAQVRRLPFFALRGDALAGVEGVALRLLERAGGKTVFTLDAADRRPAHAALLGYLVDATALAEPLQALVLELPAAVNDVVTRLRVEASDDLAQWTTLAAEAAVLRLAAGGERLERLRVEFPPYEAKYFRLSWPAARPLELAGLRAEPAAPLVEAPRRWKQVIGSPASGGEGGEYRFDLGGQFPVDRLLLRLPQPNTVAPAVILSRARNGESWRRGAASSVYRLGPAGEEVFSPEIAIAPTTDRHWLLQVDPRGGGLGAGSPELAAGWLTQRLVFAARGAPPFQLAYGSRAAAAVAYPIATLVPGYRVDDEGRSSAVPLGRASTGAPRRLAGEAALREAIDWRRWTLWGSLLLGVALLGGMALRLGRQLSASKPPDGGPDAG